MSPLILLAEDDENDAYFVHYALEKAGLSNPLFVAKDGQETLNYLNGTAPYNDREQYPLPGLLLLGLDMPGMDGFELLAWLNAHPGFNTLPIVVLTSSGRASDVQKAKDLGADDYRNKPAKFSDLVNLMAELHARWLIPHAAGPGVRSLTVLANLAPVPAAITVPTPNNGAAATVPAPSAAPTLSERTTKVASAADAHFAI
jgi:CheY-like chemotaxis protein